MKRNRTAIILLALLGWSRFAYAQSNGVIVVLSSDLAPYEEALTGFLETFGHPATVVNLSKGESEIPSSAKLIVAIGGKAAVYPYEAADAPLVFCVAPGIYVDPARHPGPIIKVYVSPSPRILIQRIQEIQPKFRRLGSLWVNESASSYGNALKKEGESLGITVLPERLKSLDELPDRLRAMKGHIDAFWIPPDPSLITPESFGIMRQFALDNNIPLYVSIDNLADKGAAVSVSVSFREMGRKTGTLAAQVLAGSSGLPTAAYGDAVSLTINAASAAQSGLAIPAELLKKAARVIP